jgi:DNA (cytosine-5)-methyltransferase 1
MSKPQFSWYEFFAGGGMARLGLGELWRCAFANEWCEKKAAAYKARFGACDELKVEDVANVLTADLPGRADLAWASFPCQDLSLAGSGIGLGGKRSGTFRPFWKLIEGLAREGRAPRLVVLENVIGALTSHRGADFTAIVRAFAEVGYRAGCLIVDAARFVPQSRPRLFVIGVSADVLIPKALAAIAPSDPWHPRPLRMARERLPDDLDHYWVWWRAPVPTNRTKTLASMIEEKPTGVVWHTPSETTYLLSLMSPLHRSKVEAAKAAGTRIVGTIYRRTRPDQKGERTQRAEVRFDNVAGCLRTPVGGSSRQTVIIVDGNQVRSRLLSPREGARLMGVPEDYPLPERYNEAYHLLGDGLVVPAVAWLENHLLRPLACSESVDCFDERIA